MTTTTKPFLSLTANDLMSPELVLIPKEMSLRAAAGLLSRHQISGAPVVDTEGRCIGVVSATDFVRWAEKDRAVVKASDTDCHCAWQVVEPETLPADHVEHHMTRDPVMVSPQSTIGELARLMLNAHIHRVIVRDERSRPIGVVSSTDILAAIARAALPLAGDGSFRIDVASSGPITPRPTRASVFRPQNY